MKGNYQGGRQSNKFALELQHWLSRSNFDILCTVSLKQGLPIGCNSAAQDSIIWSRISDADIERTAWILRDRFTKAAFGKRNNKRYPFLVFREGDGAQKRFHLHFLTVRPSDISFENFEMRFRSAALGLDWVYNEIDVRAVEDGTANRVLGYCLKEGQDAFLPAASFVPALI
jgi:hypothetical protein